MILVIGCFEQEDTREKLVMSENKVRQLEAQVHEEQLAAATRRKVWLAPRSEDKIS